MYMKMINYSKWDALFIKYNIKHYVKKDLVHI